jgi:hypothetical protein
MLYTINFIVQLLYTTFSAYLVTRDIILDLCKAIVATVEIKIIEVHIRQYR